MIRSITNADLAICEKADSFLQSAMWGRFKSRFGWRAHAFSVDWDSGGEKPLLALSRRIAPGISMAYIPWGPELPAAISGDPILAAKALEELAHSLRSLLPHVSFIRFDPPWSVGIGDQGSGIGEEKGTGDWGSGTGECCSKYRGMTREQYFSSNYDPRSPIPDPQSPFKRAAADIQPPDTVLVDLKPPLKDILAAMKPKWRYNIGLAEKRNVIVNTDAVNGNEQGINVFYQLLTETAKRDGIVIHSAEYYRALFEECSRSPMETQLHLYTAVHEGDTLAAIVVLFRRNKATYLYGASANIKRNLMAPYALQWKAMQDARVVGCTVYDLFGIPPDDNPDHPMSGLYRFKTGFGGRILHRPGSWDYPCKPMLYSLFSGAEYLRKKARDSRKR